MVESFWQRKEIKYAIHLGVLAGFSYLAYDYLTKTYNKKTTVLGPNPTQVVPLPLIKKTVLNHDTRIFRFGLPTDRSLGIPVGQHVRVTAEIDGNKVTRHYTPISSEEDYGFFELLIKIYRPDEQHPRGGALTQYIDKLEIGDTVDFTGPFGRIEYLKNGDFTVRGLRQSDPPTLIYGVKSVGLVAVGTGITPVWQIITAIFRNTTDTKEVFLIYGNRKEEDILLRKEIEALRLSFPNRLHVSLTLSQPSQSWKGDSGRVNKDLIAKKLPLPGSETIVFTCGRPAMNKDCHTSLTELGHQNNRIYQF